MVAKFAMTKGSAKRRAMKARRMGYNASVFKRKKRYAVSVTRK